MFNIPRDLSQHVVPVMQNFQRIISTARRDIGILTAVCMLILKTSFPPSAGTLVPEASSVMTDVLKFLDRDRYPLFLNVYPYYAYKEDPVRLAYAQFTATSTGTFSTFPMPWWIPSMQQRESECA